MILLTAEQVGQYYQYYVLVYDSCKPLLLAELYLQDDTVNGILWALVCTELLGQYMNGMYSGAMEHILKGY